MKKTVLLIRWYLIVILLFFNSALVFSGEWKVYDSPDSHAHSNVRTMSIDPGGYVWLGVKDDENPVGGGVVILDPAEEFISPYGTADGLCSNDVRKIIFEHIPQEELFNYERGAIWFAAACGINILDRKGILTTISSRNTPLSGNNIKTMYINGENIKWISVWGRGVCCVDSEFNWTKYSRTDGLCSSFINSIAEDINGNMWFGSKDRGVSRLDREGNWFHFSSSNSGLINDHIISIVPQSPDHIWFVTPEGISVFDGQNWMSYTSRNSPLGSFVPTCLVIDKAGNKWIGTEGGGLFEMDKFGMWAYFQSGSVPLPSDNINTMAIDVRNNLWIGTTSGLCRFTSSAVSQHHMPSGPSVSAVPGPDGYYLFEQAFMWENIGESELNPNLVFSLPVFLHGGKCRFYACLWADQDFSFRGLQYSIESDRRGNTRFRVNGGFSGVDFLISGGAINVQKDTAFDRRACYPFPESYPEGVQEFLLQGRHIPCDDPKIREIAGSLVKPDSSGDMYKTMRDIVYSKLIQHMGFIDSNVGLLKDREAGEEDAEIDSPKDVQYVLKNNKGDRHSKARLLCSLARSSGIPARMVESLRGDVWTQAWISGAGWISVEASYPACDYVRQSRTYMPKEHSDPDNAIAVVSGRHDDIGRVLWDSRVKAYFRPLDVVELKKTTQVSMAKLILMTVVSAGKVPDNAMLEITEDMAVFCRQAQDKVLLVFQDREGGQVKTVPLVFDGLANFINIRNKFFWNFIPRRLGGMLVIENLACSIVHETRQLDKGVEQTDTPALSYMSNH